MVLAARLTQIDPGSGEANQPGRLRQRDHLGILQPDLNLSAIDAEATLKVVDADSDRFIDPVVDGEVRRTSHFGSDGDCACHGKTREDRT